MDKIGWKIGGLLVRLRPIASREAAIVCFDLNECECLMGHLVTIFVTVFLAELGDKTQLATVLFASDKQMAPVLVFCAASLALIASSALAVFLGVAAEKYLTMLPLKLIAGIGFVLIGAWTIWGHFKDISA